MKHHRTEFFGWVGERIRKVQEGSLWGMLEANPAMITEFYQRDRSPQMKLNAWNGEFIGKFLISSAEIYKITRSERLWKEAQELLPMLRQAQDSDGYLGVFTEKNRLLGNYYDYNKRCEYPTWDLWNHYHCISGLLAWYDLTGNAGFFEIAEKAGICCGEFLETHEPPEMHFEKAASMVHAYALLFERSGNPRYQKYRDTFMEYCGKREVMAAELLSGKEFYQTAYPRWEALHFYIGLLEWYAAEAGKNGEYLEVGKRLYRSITKWDIHNNGGFSSGEQATGDVYRNLPIETCCNVAWEAFVSRLYLLTGESSMIDTLEKLYFNSIMGALHPSGKWSTYNTPMVGERIANTTDIVFQSAACLQVNCCSVNAPGGLGRVEEWAFREDKDRIYVNYYGACRYQGEYGEWAIRMESEYPADGNISVYLEGHTDKKILFRVPQFVDHMMINGKEDIKIRKDVEDGGYYEWIQPEEYAELKFLYKVRSEEGKGEQEGKLSFAYGPLTLAADTRFQPWQEIGISGIPEADSWRRCDVKQHFLPPLLCMETQDLVLCDFASAGITGTRYTSWIPQK